MFKGISHRIALQFTAFVFLLFMVNGAVFLAADSINAERRDQFRFERQSRPAFDLLKQEPLMLPPPIAPPLRERLRILDASGQTLYAGVLFPDIPFRQKAGLMRHMIGEEQVMIMTSLPGRNGITVQVAEPDRFQQEDAPLRVGMYLLVSILVSGLTYLLGLSFARRNLKPAEEMMERLEQFTQDASHELRTPLAALRSSLDLALKTGRHREGIESAKEDVDGVTRLVDRLLELTSLDQFHLTATAVDLSSLLQSSVDRYRALASERHVHIVGTIASGVTVRGDSALLQQAVGNLLTNAIKFSKPGGGTVHVNLTAEEFMVRDEGIGIALSDLPNIFHRFFQADVSRSRGGYGLGLALVKRIVDLHGWTMGTESAEGEGTTFRVRFAGG